MVAFVPFSDAPHLHYGFLKPAPLPNAHALAFAALAHELAESQPT